MRSRKEIEKDFKTIPFSENKLFLEVMLNIFEEIHEIRLELNKKKT